MPGTVNSYTEEGFAEIQCVWESGVSCRASTSLWERAVMAPGVQLWFKGLSQLLEIRIELIKIVGDLEHCIFLKGVGQP